LKNLVGCRRQIAPLRVTYQQGRIESGKKLLRHDRAPVTRAELPRTVFSTAQRKQSGVADGRRAASVPARAALYCATAVIRWREQQDRPTPPVTNPDFGKRSAQARKGRRHQRSKPDGRDSARSVGRSPRTRRRHAGMPNSIGLSAIPPFYRHYPQAHLRLSTPTQVSLTAGSGKNAAMSFRSPVWCRHTGGRHEQSKPMGTRQAVCRNYRL